MIFRPGNIDRLMMQLLLSILLFASWILPCSSTNIDNDITGLWKSTDGKSEKPRTLVAIYKYEGKYYGRMLAIYDNEGKFKDTILEGREKADGVVGNPPYCGMDFVYDVRQSSNNRYKGKIIDPEKGDVYKVELSLRGDDLIVRGKLWIFGKNITWTKASEKDLPQDFKMSEILHFVSVIPEPFE